MIMANRMEALSTGDQTKESDRWMLEAISSGALWPPASRLYIRTTFASFCIWTTGWKRCMRQEERTRLTVALACLKDSRAFLYLADYCDTMNY